MTPNVATGADAFRAADCCTGRRRIGGTRTGFASVWLVRRRAEDFADVTTVRATLAILAAGNAALLPSQSASWLLRRVLALLLVGMLLSSCASWRGIAKVPMPGGPGTGSNYMTIYLQMPDTLALNINSRVRVADVFVGRVRTIELTNWVATLTLDVDPNVKLPADSTASIGQTSLLVRNEGVSGHGDIHGRCDVRWSGHFVGGAVDDRAQF